jgi:hypothetical protein
LYVIKLLELAIKESVFRSRFRQRRERGDSPSQSEIALPASLYPLVDPLIAHLFDFLRLFEGKLMAESAQVGSHADDGDSPGVATDSSKYSPENLRACSCGMS